jgi:histidine triad (HIT) family protein
MIQGQVDVPKVYEDNDFICIRDIHPQAKAHFLVIPKTHIESLAEAFSREPQIALMGKLLAVGTQVAEQEGLLPSGFRSVINTGREAGQSVFHIHLHILGGQSLASFGA